MSIYAIHMWLHLGLLFCPILFCMLFCIRSRRSAPASRRHHRSFFFPRFFSSSFFRLLHSLSLCVVFLYACATKPTGRPSRVSLRRRVVAVAAAAASRLPCSLNMPHMCGGNMCKKELCTDAWLVGLYRQKIVAMCGAPPIVCRLCCVCFGWVRDEF